MLLLFVFVVEFGWYMFVVLCFLMCWLCEFYLCVKKWVDCIVVGVIMLFGLWLILNVLKVGI